MSNRRRPRGRPDRAVREFERALRRQGCPDCGSRKTKLTQRGHVPDVTLVHGEGCARLRDTFGGNDLAANAAKAARLRFMANDSGGGGIVRDGVSSGTAGAV
jgi:hypothetical protein